MDQNVQTFEGLKLKRQFLNAIDEEGWETPTEIQSKAIPLALDGHDILGIAQTGTGKSAAFLLPLLSKLKFHKPKGPFALVLAPTRELIIQIHDMAKSLATYTDLKIVSIYGGLGPKTQIENLEEGCDLLLATPGRFLDLYLNGHFPTKGIKTMVLDEADKMMDMGFMPQIRRILEVIPVKRQNLLFSATMPPQVIELSHEFLDFPQKIEVTPQATAVETVSQELFHVPNMRTKINLLEYLLDLDSESVERAIVFTRKKSTADNIGKYLGRKEHGDVRIIHANKGQNSRINAINAFKSGEIRILVSTDVTARGIDVSDVSHVINFDVPLIYEDYVHRIGRTGRARKSGKAITFCTESEKYHIQKIEEIIRQSIPVSEMPKSIEITDTPFEERQEMMMEIDRQKRREDPSFKGAFHEKKKNYPKNKKKRRPRR